MKAKSDIEGRAIDGRPYQVVQRTTGGVIATRPMQTKQYNKCVVNTCSRHNTEKVLTEWLQ